MMVISLLFPMNVQANQVVAEVAAPHAILMEVSTGTVLMEKAADEKVHPASVTKIMTMLLIMEALEQGKIALNDTVTVSEYAASMGGSQVYLEPYETQTVETLLKCVAVASANDAAVALAEHISGSVDAFVELMNQKAASLGCTNTHFTNPNGLPDENHYTTAHDMALIAKAAYQNETFRIITGTARYTIPPTNKHDEPTDLQNHNEMLYPFKTLKYRYEYCTGGKTGYTSEAGQCLASLAKVDDVEYILVTAGAPGGPSTEPYHIEDAKTVYNRIQAGEQGSVADTAADSQDDQATTGTDEAA